MSDIKYSGFLQTNDIPTSQNAAADFPHISCFEMLWSMYPCCPDDEVREFLFGVRTKKKHLPYMRTSRMGDPIWVGDNSNESALTQSVDKSFKCSWPDVVLKATLPTLDLPASIEQFASSIQCFCRESTGDKAFEFYPIQIIQDPNDGPGSVAAAMTRFRLALCTVFDVTASKASPWTDVCNSMLESVWHDNLRDAHVSVSFRPRWSLYPTIKSEPGEWPVIVPDVVFSAVVPVDDSARLLEALPYHPAYVFSDQSTEYKTLEIPILIVEYGKINLLQDDQPPRPPAHQEHLKAAIAAALPMHSVLGLKTPIYGVFIDITQTGESWAGSIAEVQGDTMPVTDRVAVMPEGFFEFRREPLHILLLHSIIANLGRSASSILDEIRNDTTSVVLKPNVCPVEETFRCTANRRRIDTRRPPLVVEDDTLQFLFLLDAVDAARWLSESDITIADMTALEPAQEIQDWMHLFAEPEPLPEAWIRTAVVDALKGLSGRAQGLASDFLSKYRYASTFPSTPLPDSPQAVLDYDIRASLTICSHATDLYETPVNGLNPHSASSHWSMIYNSLYMRAIQKPQDPMVSFETHPRWQLHKNLHSFITAEAETLFPEEIRPSCALSYVLDRDHNITRTSFPPDRDVEECDVQDLGPELTVNRLAGALWQASTVKIPLMVGEYVLVPGDSDEREKHLAHLAMTMRSALALWEIHCLKGPVVGFLMERNIVETKLGWIDDDGKCIIRDASEYKFDLLDPCDTFRMYNFVKVFCSESFGNKLTEKVDAQGTTAIQRLLDPSYQTWRENV